jgi:hypothetical protein
MIAAYHIAATLLRWAGPYRRMIMDGWLHTVANSLHTQ